MRFWYALPAHLWHFIYQISLQVDGFDPYYIQKNVQRIIAGVKTSVTLRTVVAQVADVVDGWIRQASIFIRSLWLYDADCADLFLPKVSKTAVADGQLAFGDGYGRIGMKDMYLVGLRKSGSTVQILLAYDPSTVFPPLEFYA